MMSVGARVATGVSQCCCREDIYWRERLKVRPALLLRSYLHCTGVNPCVLVAFVSAVAVDHWSCCNSCRWGSAVPCSMLCRWSMPSTFTTGIGHAHDSWGELYDWLFVLNMGLKGLRYGISQQCTLINVQRLQQRNATMSLLFCGPAGHVKDHARCSTHQPLMKVCYTKRHRHH